MNKAKLLILILTVVWMGCMGNAMAAETNRNVLGPGDVIKIFVYGHPDLTTEVKINETGNITFPLLGEIFIDGLTPASAEKKIAKQLESKDIIRRPQVNILASSLQSQMVSVLGLVRNQGRYPVDGKRSVTDILAMAGGVIPEGGEVVTLIRSEGNSFSKEVIDIIDMIRSNDLGRNVTVRSDDLIYVDRAPRFYIYGEVQRAGVYKLERNMTVIQGLSVGGGLTQRGTERGLRIQRRDAQGNLQILSVNPSDLIQPDDVIYIRESLF